MPTTCAANNSTIINGLPTSSALQPKVIPYNTFRATLGYKLRHWSASASTTLDSQILTRANCNISVYTVHRYWIPFNFPVFQYLVCFKKEIYMCILLRQANNTVIWLDIHVGTGISPSLTCTCAVHTCLHGKCCPLACVPFTHATDVC